MPNTSRSTLIVLNRSIPLVSGICAIIAASGTAAVTAFDASFRAFDAGLTPASAVVGDLNADGALDVVVVNRETNTVSVLPGQGGGTFGTPAVFPVGNRPSSMAIADLNGDG